MDLTLLLVTLVNVSLSVYNLWFYIGFFRRNRTWSTLIMLFPPLIILVAYTLASLTMEASQAGVQLSASLTSLLALGTLMITTTASIIQALAAMLKYRHIPDVIKTPAEVQDPGASDSS